MFCVVDESERLDGGLIVCSCFSDFPPLNASAVIGMPLVRTMVYAQPRVAPPPPPLIAISASSLIAEIASAEILNRASFKSQQEYWHQQLL